MTTTTVFLISLVVFLLWVGSIALACWWTWKLTRDWQAPATDAARFAGDMNRSLSKSVETAHGQFLSLAALLAKARREESPNGQHVRDRETVPVYEDDLEGERPVI